MSVSMFTQDVNYSKDQSPRLLTIFFFSSRRRHTRCSRDWSSDVCSSDLASGNPVSGVAVTFAASPGSGTVTPTTPVATGANGIAAATSWTLSATAGQNTATATATGLAGSPVTFTATRTAGAATRLLLPTPPPSTARRGPALAPQPAGQLPEAHRKPPRQSNVGVTGTPSSGGSVTGSNPTTGTDGIATVGSWTLAPTAGTNTLTATATGSGISGNPVTFTATGTVGPVSATTSTVGAAPPSIPAGSGTSTIRVTARDAGGNTIGGASVFLTATGGTGNTLTPATGTTDPTTGVLTGTFDSTRTGGKTISATINTVAITQTAPVTVTAGAATQNAAQGQRNRTAPL